MENFSATTGFMTSYKRQPSGRKRKILKKSKNTVKRKLGLCINLHVWVCVEGYICVLLCMDV